MKKTINISIGGMSFQIEEDAFERLDAYLKSIKSHFSSYPESGEIVSDIEDRVADQFSAKSGVSKIITLPVVEELIGVMGKAEEMGGEKSENPKASANEFKAFGKRLYRNTDDAIIAGVCSGLAAYIGVDPVWVRLAFAISIFFGGFGVLLYIILWVIVPEAKTDTEKMQMRGEPINLKNVEATIKERVEELKKKDHSGVKKVLSAPFRAISAVAGALGPAVKKLFSIILRIIGFGLTIGAAFALAGLVFAAISIIFNGNSQYVDFPLKEVAAGALFYLAAVSAFFVAFVPVVFIMLVGTSLLAMKSTFTRLGSIGLAALWIVAIAIAANVGFKLAPQIESAINSSENYQTVSKQIDAKDFTKIALSSDYEAAVYPANEFKVMAVGREKDLSELHTYVEDGAFVAVRDSYFKFCLFCINKSIKFEIYMPELNGVDLSGASDVTASGFSSPEFFVKLSGASKAYLSIDALKLDAQLSGASKLELKGLADEVILKESGASKTTAEELIVKNATVELSGASKAYFGDLENLKVKASGASKVYYSSAVNIEEDLSGSSRTIKQDVPGSNEADDYPPIEFTEPTSTQPSL